MKTIKFSNGLIECITTSFMRKTPYTYFCVWHKYNGVEVYSNLLDATAFILDNQLTINFSN